MARMIRNRTAAQASRDRKKEHVAELEHRVKELEAQLSHQQALACCHQHSTSTSTFTLPPSLDSNPTIDPSIATAGTTTLSPAQVEYLTTVRIHFLEEENAQLKAQLELELKRSAELRSNLSRNFCSATEPDLDQTLLGLILKEDELSCSPSLLDPALTGECQPVTPSPLRPTQNSGPTSTDHRLVAREEDLSQQRIGRNWSRAALSHWEWTLMWCWVAWKTYALQSYRSMPNQVFKMVSERTLSPSLQVSLNSWRMMNSLNPTDLDRGRELEKNQLRNRNKWRGSILGSNPSSSPISSFRDSPSTLLFKLFSQQVLLSRLFSQTVLLC